jgi:hypothetical protein
MPRAPETHWRQSCRDIEDDVAGFKAVIGGRAVGFDTDLRFRF